MNARADTRRFNRGLMMFAMLSMMIAALPAKSQSPYIVYPDHSHLLVVRDVDGVEKTITNVDQWSVRAAHIRAGMEQAMGKLPDLKQRTDLNIQKVGEPVHVAGKNVGEGDYIRQKLTFDPEVGDRVPAWLLTPVTNVSKTPAMLCLHQTNNVGKDEPAGLGGLPSLHYAHELACRGYVCLVPDYPSFGEYRYDFKVQGKHYASGSMKAIWNNIRAVDLLASLDVVDANRIGVIGHSLGGHNSLFTAVFDDRLKAVVTSCGFTPFHDYYGGKVAGWTSDRYMPRIRDVYENNADKIPFDFYEVLAVLAPRGCFSNSPIRDDNFDVGGVRKAYAKASEVYKLFDANSQLVLHTPDCAHDFPEPMRQAAYAWLDQLFAHPSR